MHQRARVEQRAQRCSEGADRLVATERVAERDDAHATEPFAVHGRRSGDRARPLARAAQRQRARTIAARDRERSRSIAGAGQRQIQSELHLPWRQRAQRSAEQARRRCVGCHAVDRDHLVAGNHALEGGIAATAHVADHEAAVAQRAVQIGCRRHQARAVGGRRPDIEVRVGKVARHLLQQRDERLRRCRCPRQRREVGRDGRPIDPRPFVVGVVQRQQLHPFGPGSRRIERACAGRDRRVTGTTVRPQPGCAREPAAQGGEQDGAATSGLHGCFRSCAIVAGRVSARCTLSRVPDAINMFERWRRGE